MTLLPKTSRTATFVQGKFLVRSGVIHVRELHLRRFSDFMKRNDPEPLLEDSESKKRKITMATTKITLTPREAQLRQILLDVAESIDESKILKEKLELRFAGGWVRDKLLGIESHDIDVAINAMTGFPFCQEMQTYLKEDDNLGKHSLEAKDIGNLHQVLANPEKSKHLETATTRLLGLDLDFVNLRKETYTENSRNPIMEFGTAREDALRRDATINALFYNIHSDEVEDFTEGLKDLNAMRIRTPLEPKTTFMDDPLRVLRLIRFASRLNFRIDADCEAVMSDPAVMEALKVKISRERVGVELGKMLADKSPITALQLFDRLGLYSTIFTDPDAKDSPKPDSSNWHLAFDFLQELEQNKAPGSVYQVLVGTGQAPLAWMLACFTPWAEATGETKKAKVKLPFGAMAAREGVKTDNKVTNLIAGALKQRTAITNLKNAILSKEEYTNERDTVGMMLRKWDIQGSWRLQVLFAILVEGMNGASERYPTVVHQWQAFVDHLDTLDVLDVTSEKPIIDGVKLLKAFGIAKGGPWLTGALEYCLRWQLRNPGNKDTEAVIEEIKKRKEELKIPDK